MSRTDQPGRGLLISFDGLDSSGKATQARLLIERLRGEGRTVLALQSPDYSSASGRKLKTLLQDKQGRWSDVSWQKKLDLFATNRVEHREEVISALTKGTIVVYDRYVPSGYAFIAVEALGQHEIARKRNAIHKAINAVEYDMNNMPKEDVSVFLNIPPTVAQALLKQRNKKLGEQEYTDKLELQQRMYQEYKWLCAHNPKRFLKVQCVAKGTVMTVEEVADRVWYVLAECLPILHQER